MAKPQQVIPTFIAYDLTIIINLLIHTKDEVDIQLKS